jgi:hypothetical protein
VNETLSISIIVGFFMSPAISVISREKWNPQLKAVAAFVLCVIAAVVTAWYEATTNWHDLRGVLIAVFSASIASYHLFWKPSGAANAISKVTG